MQLSRKTAIPLIVQIAQFSCRFITIPPTFTGSGSMREIVPTLLWIGNAADARAVSAVLDLGIEAIVDLALEEVPARMTRDVIYCRFPLVDGGGNPLVRLHAAIDAVLSLIEKRVPTLVCCGAGMSRAPAPRCGPAIVRRLRQPVRISSP